MYLQPPCQVDFFPQIYSVPQLLIISQTWLCQTLMPYDLSLSMILLELKCILMKKANHKKNKAVEIQLVF